MDEQGQTYPDLDRVAREAHEAIAKLHEQSRAELRAKLPADEAEPDSGQAE
ncbi:hypothetical protein [Qaidamihabitans albus]|uniref:hypothetical protein n=1 Tax=Qaidamihabitans albus TaxID=2795733 RepID=UPI0018F25C7A|nr:hypothetical protein [Qaidamihabitans albus]